MGLGLGLVLEGGGVLGLRVSLRLVVRFELGFGVLLGFEVGLGMGGRGGWGRGGGGGGGGELGVRSRLGGGGSGLG